MANQLKILVIFRSVTGFFLPLIFHAQKNSSNHNSTLFFREDVRGVAGVALATPFTIFSGFVLYAI